MEKKESHIISKYFLDTLNSEEQSELKKRLQKKNNLAVFEQYAVANHFADLSNKAFDANEAYKKFTEVIDSEETSSSKKIFSLLKPYYKYAAILFILIFLSFFYLNKVDTNNKNMASIIVPASEKRSLKLPDGTEILINSASKLSYNKDFTKNRLVKLNGEAYFKVAKYKGKPFIIELNPKTRIKVLGTTFDVKSYSEDTRIETALFEGKIEIVSAISGDKNTILKPNTIAIIDKEKNTLELLNNTDYIQNTLVWQNDVLSFDDQCLKDIINELNRFYNVEISLNSKELESQYFSASFKKGTSLDDILRDLSITGNFTVKKLNSTHFEISSI